MRQPTISTLAHSAFLLALALTTACGGGGVQGLYSGGDDAFFQSLEFKSDGKVEITFMGMAREGTYVIEDDRVKVTASGDTQIFKIRDDGCLAGGGLVGTYCKGGERSGVATSGSSGEGSDSGTLAGRGGLRGTYEAGNEAMRISLRFQDAQRVRVMVMSPGANNAADGSYTVTGDRVVITADGEAMTFARQGDALVGDFDGMAVRFVRK